MAWTNIHTIRIFWQTCCHSDHNNNTQLYLQGHVTIVAQLLITSKRLDSDKKAEVSSKNHEAQSSSTLVYLFLMC